MPALERMIDANANRAREALRVLEDAARFGLDHEALCAEYKSIRHGLREALGALRADGSALLASRDTAGDVGTGVTASGEGERSSLREVAEAAGKRLGEALRSLEECAKALGGGTWEAIEALRYRSYEAERALLLGLAGGRAPQWRVCVVVTGSLCVSRTWEEVVRASLAAGADCVQVREKSLEGGAVAALGRRAVALARAAWDGAGRRAAVIINDRADVALACGADGVHVGQGDLRVRDVRALCGAGLLVGVSTEGIEQAREALRDGADYCGVGPMFATRTKEKPRVAGPAYMRAYASHAPALPPHLAIGGVTPENAASLREAGARGVAVSSAVCGSSDPGSVVRRLVEAMSG